MERGVCMKKIRYANVLSIAIVILYLSACTTGYKAKPLPFKAPDSYPNAQEFSGATIAAKAYVDANEAKGAFGFDVRGAGMLPIEIVFDNRGPHPLEINAAQTFLEDNEGNLWPILADRFAYERATKYAQTKEIFKEGAYGGFLGAAAGAIIGAAIGVVSGDNVASAAGKGAALGGAAGATIGGVKGYSSDDARRTVMRDFRDKSLQAKEIEPNSLAFGFIFFPGEATSAKQLRIKIAEKDTGTSRVLYFGF